MRHLFFRLLSAVLLRGLVHDFPELAGEIVAVMEAAVEGYFRNAAGGLPEQFRSVLNADMQQMLDRRAVHTLVKDSLKVPFGKMSLCGQLVQCGWLGKTGFNMNNGIPQPQ
jgi:hypothetical protein